MRLRRWVAHAAAGRASGALRLSGSPGGVLRFSDGLVVAAESPGAPGVQAILVRSGRVSDEDWARDGGGHAAAAARIGAAHRQVLQLMADQDALFAVLAGLIDACALEPDPPDLPDPVASARPGQDAAALLDAAFRKLDALAALPRAILPHRERLVARPADDSDDASRGGSPAMRRPELRRVILGHADGRRTARDIAFVSGRSLYAVTVEMSRMLAEDLLREPPPRTGPTDTSPVRVLPRNPLPASAGSAHSTEAPSGLPRRQPPADGAAKDPADDAAKDPASQKTPAFWRDFLHIGGRIGESRN